MLGQMMNHQLTLTSVMLHGHKQFKSCEVVSVTSDYDRHYCTFGNVFERAGNVANYLKTNNIEKSDRIATLAWNDFRHMELYYGISCYGAVCHTINPRLHPDQIKFIVNDASDKQLYIDVMFIELIKSIRSELASVEKVIVLTSDKSVIDGLDDSWMIYEDIIEGQSADFDWPSLSENDPCSLCYTSGTTGNPKGVLYSHRSLVLHSMSAIAPDAMAISKRDCVLPIVPMFHVNAWGLIYIAAMVGCKLVLAGHKVANAVELHKLMTEEKVTLTAGVPTVLKLLSEYLMQYDLKIPSLTKILVGGSAIPSNLYSYYVKEHNIVVIHAWGMTETSPLGTINHIQPIESDKLNQEDLLELQLKQGHAIYGVDIKIIDENGKELPWDGEHSGNLLVRGAWVVAQYFKRPENKIADGEWFDTGDIATIDQYGIMKITDRKKDVIKSGGEWISSVDIENTAMLHKEISLAAVIGISHPKWDERPLLVIERSAAKELSIDEINAYLEGKIAKWWLPDAIVYVDNLPMTATGKVHKLILRDKFKDFKLA